MPTHTVVKTTVATVLTLQDVERRACRMQMREIIHTVKCFSAVTVHIGHCGMLRGQAN